MQIDEYLRLDAERRAVRVIDYDPIVGNPADRLRVEVETPQAGLPRAYVPRTMVDDPQYPTTLANEIAWRRLRCRHDFEFWCASCVTIKDKTTGADCRFRLNAPQRAVLEALEDDRRAMRPIRLIMLKARQWGGSTLVQTYMAWIQSCHCRNWHSIICSQVKDTSTGIRGMYTKLLDNYPSELWDGDEPPRFRPYERSTNVREISGRGCRVTVSSIENQDAVRGADFAMAHLSETAFWRKTPSHEPEDVIRAICGSIALLPYSLIAMESTANGVGNYFHREWLRCSKGEGDKRAIFVPWYDIEIYRLSPPDPAALLASMDAYEWMLWNDCGCALDQIYWYRLKRREYADHAKMMAEYPSTPDEAFAATSSAVFACQKVEALRLDCRPGAIGDITEQLCWADDPCGFMKLWARPAAGARYVVAVDIGGRSEKADFSVAAVMRLAALPSERHEIVAQWRGHADLDILALKIVQIARFYNNALLVIESNTLESGAHGRGMYILDEIAHRYSNLYRRRQYDRLARCETEHIGFHTNVQTKEIIIHDLIAAVRLGLYIERDEDACNELLTYETHSDGSYAAKSGCHDDILMTRAIALHAAKHAPTASPANISNFLKNQRGF